MTEFVLVSKNHRLCRKQKNIQKVIAPQPDLHLETSTSSFVNKLKAAIVELDAVGFADEVISKLKVVLRCENNSIDSINIVSYGLGSFTSSYTSCYQLALLELIRRTFEAKECVVYDPIFSAQDREWLQTNGYVIQETNAHAQYPVTCKTVFYMPHCGRPLYNNVLYSNWAPDRLERIVIIGNSLRKIVESLPQSSSSCLDPCLYYVRHSASALVEVSLPSFPPAEDAFNDTSIHSFANASSLISLAQWSYTVEPQYSSTEFVEEIIL